MTFPDSYVIDRGADGRPLTKTNAAAAQESRMNDLFPATVAANAEVPLRPYRPSNGTEGACFHERWCAHCARDAAMRGAKDIDECDDNEKCQIVADTFAFDENDPRYPKEWRYDANGHPVCTAFVEYAGQDGRETWQRTLDEISGVVA